MTTVHRPRVVRVRAETPDGEAFRFAMSCRCGVRGEHATRAAAVADREEHIRVVAAPEEARCQRRAEHGTRWWDECLLCSSQLELFDLAEVAL